MATMTEIAQDLRDARAEVQKIRVEQAAASAALSQRIADLEAAIAAGGVSTPEVDEAMTDLKVELKSFDDTIPDPA